MNDDTHITFRMVLIMVFLLCVVRGTIGCHEVSTCLSRANASVLVCERLARSFP